MKTLKELQELTEKWSADKYITINGKASTQMLKLISEAGELAGNIPQRKCIKDDIGDCLVVITNLSVLTNSIKIDDVKPIIYEAKPLLQILGFMADNVIKNNNLDRDIISLVTVLKQLALANETTLEECWELAYDEIKDRQGILNEHGNFIKSTDPVYEETVRRLSKIVEEL